MNAKQRFGRARFARLAAVCMMTMAAMSPVLGAYSVSARARDDVPPDLAAMTLLPADLEAEGLEDHGIYASILTDRPRTVAEQIEYHNWDTSVDDGEAFKEADADRTYHMILSVEHIIDDLIYADYAVASFVMEYEDDEAAEDGFAAAAGSWEGEESLEIGRPRVDLGDEQALFEGTGTKARSGNSFERMTLLFQTGNLVGGITIYGFTGEAPEQSTIEALGEIQLDRMEQVTDEGGPGLSGLVPRFRLDGDLVNFDHYSVRDGEVVPRAGNTDDEAVAEDQARVDRSGVVDRYQFEQVVYDGWAELDLEIYAFYNGLTIRFVDEDAASGYMASTRDEFEADTRAEFVESPGLADESMAVVQELPSPMGDPRQRYAIFYRHGDTVFRLAHVTDTAYAASADLDLQPMPDVINEMAERQLACVEGEASCERTIRLPLEMRGPQDKGQDVVGLLTIPLLPARTTAERRPAIAIHSSPAR